MFRPAMLAALGMLLCGNTLTAPTFAEEKKVNQAAANPESPPERKNRLLGIVLFEGFELLDVCGPAEIFANVGASCKVVMVAEKTGPVRSTQGVQLVADYGFDDCPHLDLLLVPGGIGTRTERRNPKLLDWLKKRSPEAEMTMSVCTGSGILAEAGLLDGRKATTNKVAYPLITAWRKEVQWVRQARWVDDGDMVTSSGVSAGMDMALHVVARLYSQETAERVARLTEYQWHRDANNDPFAQPLAAGGK